MKELSDSERLWWKGIGKERQEEIIHKAYLSKQARYE